MSPDELLNSADIELHSLSASLSRDELQKLFDAIWERVRPLYAGQPKSIESAHGLALSQAALSVASHGGDSAGRRGIYVSLRLALFSSVASPPLLYSVE